VKEHVDSTMSNSSDLARQPLMTAADRLYQSQLKGVNACRTQFAAQLKAKIADGAALASPDAIAAAVRGVFKDVVLANVNIIVSDAWTELGKAMVLSGVQQAQDKFFADIWPAIEKALDELQSMIPEALASLGLQIVPLARTVAGILITKGTTFAVTKVILALEKQLFAQ